MEKVEPGRLLDYNPLFIAMYSTFEASPPRLKQQHSYIESATFISKLTFGWATPLVALTKKRLLATDDLSYPWHVDDKIKAAFTLAFEKHASLWKAFATTHGIQFSLFAFAQVVIVACRLYGPAYVLGQLMQSVNAPAFDMVHVFWLVLSLYALLVVKAFLETHVDFAADMLGAQFDALLHSMILEKSLHRRTKTSHIERYLDKNAASSVAAFPRSVMGLWGSFLQLGVIVWFYFQLVGSSIFVGLAAIVALVVLRTYVAMVAANVRVKTTSLSVQRLASISELFATIQTIKMAALEEKFLTAVHRLRDIEVDSMWQFSCYITAWTVLMQCTPIVGLLVVILTGTTWLDETLSVVTIFTALALLDILRASIIDGATAIKLTFEALGCIHALERVLVVEKAASSLAQPDALPISNESKNSHVAISIENATFGWTADQPLFQDLEVEIYRGEFVVLYGSDGQGKSSLCSFLLNETLKTRGTVHVAGRVAYVAQAPWIQQASIRDNILFGQPYDRLKYQRVLDACGLTQEIALFPSGDRAEVGSNGVSLTPDQITRLSLARAGYSDADIYILDSPLASIDPSKVDAIFKSYFLGLLKQKTIVLVSNDDKIVTSEDVNRTFLVQDGTLVETTYDTLTDVASTALTSTAERRTSSSASSTTPSSTTSSFFEALGFTPRALDGFNDEAVEAYTGRWSAFSATFAYGKAFGGRTVIVIVLFASAAVQGAKLYTDIWLSEWDAEAETPQSLASYSWIIFWRCFFLALHSVLVFSYGSSASQFLFRTALETLVRAPMRYFDATPVDHILARFRDDIAACDLILPAAFARLLLETSSLGLSVVVLFVFSGWLSWAIGIPLLVLYIRFVPLLFVAPTLTRMQSTKQTALSQLTREATQGSVTIRAFGSPSINHIRHSHRSLLDRSCSAKVISSGVNQFVQLRVQLMGHTMAFVFLLASMSQHESIGAGLMGLLISYALTIPTLLATLPMVWSRFNSQLHSSDRLLELTHVENEGGRGFSTYESWPTEGRIWFQNVSFRYTRHEPLALRNITFNIRGAEKIALVGARGAGKSTVAMALFRINELASGSIKIDGINIATLGLKALRSNLAFVPQVPVLFRGTVRHYLDPLDEYKDDAIWTTLRKLQVDSLVGRMEHKLLELVEDVEGAFNASERLKLCLAGALLREAKIVVLDEITTGLDDQADQFLLRIVRDEFASSTVLTIAHRLDTVLDCDRIIVLDRGELVQIETPQVLLAQRSGVFFDLVTREASP
ncbi:hypothetical protein LEN26_007437 [Aphanomyces euteiches]|nr:hypothetical protein LEN26_007437 [Aphanomyces euteiches]